MLIILKLMRVVGLPAFFSFKKLLRKYTYEAFTLLQDVSIPGNDILIPCRSVLIVLLLVRMEELPEFLEERKITYLSCGLMMHYEDKSS